LWTAGSTIVSSGGVAFAPTGRRPRAGRNQPTYLHHFYDPINRTNWAHDDQSLQWAYLESGFAPFYETTTAYDESSNYFREAVRAWHRLQFADAGYYLGLALHFFADPTQPMHALGYINTYFDRTHGEFEEFANTLLRDSDLWPSPPPPFEVPTATDPGSIVDTAATRARQHFPALISNIIKTGASIAKAPVLYPDWKSRVTGLTKSLLRDAASAAAQYLWVWATHALRGFDPYGDDGIRITGALASYDYHESYVRLVGSDTAGVTYERFWDEDGITDWTEAEFRPAGATESQNVGPIVVAPGDLASFADDQTDNPICLITISADGHLLETCFAAGNPEMVVFASDWIDRGPIRYGGNGPSQAASLCTLQRNDFVEAFAVSDSGQLLRAIRYRGTWRGWDVLPVFYPLAGPFNGNPDGHSAAPTGAVSPLAATYNTTVGVEVFAIAKTGDIARTYLRVNDPNPNWVAEGFPASGLRLRTTPGSLAVKHFKGDPDGEPQVFAITDYGALLRLVRDDIVDTLDAPPGAGGLASIVASNVFNPVDLFATTNDGSLYHRAYVVATGWSQWIRIGTSGRKSVAVPRLISRVPAAPAA
jgi:hypothetical protein